MQSRSLHNAHYRLYNLRWPKISNYLNLIKELLYTPVCRARRCGVELEPSLPILSEPTFFEKALTRFGSPKPRVTRGWSHSFIRSSSSVAMKPTRESPGETPNPKKIKTQGAELQEESNPAPTDPKPQAESEIPEPEPEDRPTEVHNPVTGSRRLDSELNKPEINKFKTKTKNVKPGPGSVGCNLRGSSPGRSSLERVRSAKPTLERSRSLHGRSSGQGARNSIQHFGASVNFGKVKYISAIM